ncbi:HDOD domain-containing protein [Opitutus terrae]|nr:HDOD domain-containing protein [Opitutus terrae]
MPDYKPPSLEQVCERALRLPCSPALLPRLIMALQSHDSSADDIAAVVTVDPGLASATLRLANSAYFGAAIPAENVAEAVIRLGQHELYRLAALALVSRWESGTASGEAGDFCRHALCTALAAEVLAETTERVPPQTAYTAGLVCDLGKLALTHACADFYPAIRAHSAANHCAWTDSERTVLGYDYVEVGAHLLKAWNFPKLLVAVADFYLHPTDAPAEALPLIAHLHAAKYIATSFGPGVGEGGFLFELNETFLLEWGFTPELLQEAMPIVHERAISRLRDKLSQGMVSM